MKRKQKKILMIVLGVAAAILFSVQVGPILFGGPVSKPSGKPGSGSKKTGAAPSAGAKKPGGAPAAAPRAAPRAAPKAAARGPAATHPAPEAAADEFSGALLSVPIDLSAAPQRLVPYGGEGFRSPFGPALFETRRHASVFDEFHVKLEGIIANGSRRVAIIDGRVFSQGGQVKEGISVLSIGPDSVTLTDGVEQLRLTLSVPDLRVGRP